VRRLTVSPWWALMPSNNPMPPQALDRASTLLPASARAGRSRPHRGRNLEPKYYLRANWGNAGNSL